MPAKFDPQIVRSNRKTLTLQILPDATILVKAPMKISLRVINQFLDKHQNWIDQRLKLVEKRKVTKKQYIEGEEYWFLGEKYQLKFGNYTQIQVHGEHLLFPVALQFRAKKELENWYIKQAKKIILIQLELYAGQMDAKYKSVTFSDTKSQWGRCTRDNRLQFCWRLVMAPILAINYVVVHELTHTTEKHHQRSFWSKVRFFNPSYRQQIKWLKENGKSLVF